MIISKRALEILDNEPNIDKFTTEYFVCADSKDIHIRNVIKEHQSNLPKLLEELNAIGYGVNATVLKSGRVLIMPIKKNNGEDGMMGMLLGGSILSAFIFVCFVVKLVGLFF